MMSAKQPRGTEGEAWGILNPYGDVWTYRTFETEKAARDHVRKFWDELEGGKVQRDLKRFRPVRVKVHVTVAPKPAPPAAGGEA